MTKTEKEFNELLDKIREYTLFGQAYIYELKLYEQARETKSKDEAFKEIMRDYN